MLKRICGNCVFFNPHRPMHPKCKGCGAATERVNFLPRDMNCPMCGTSMIYHKYEFLRCPDCGSEFWPFVDKPDVIREEFEKNLPCERNTDVSSGLMHVKAKKSGSKSGKTRSNKKQKLQKPSTTELYKRLCN